MTRKSSKGPNIFGPVLRIVIPYVLLGAAWILFSDRLLILVIDDPTKLLEISTAKGWLYVLITGVLLFSLVSRELMRRSALERELRRGIVEKGELLAELNHRVKNNLQIISSILSLEAEGIVGLEALELNDRTRARIRTMGIAHERLFEEGEIARIDLGGYLRALWDLLCEVFHVESASVDFDVASLSAGPEEAVPFGLFATEAISNAIRYGANEDGRIEVAIELKDDGKGNLEFIVRDRGHGYPEGAMGLGFRLMDALALQLGGKVQRRNAGGAELCLRFSRSVRQDAQP